MMPLILKGAPGERMGPSTSRSLVMKWETPLAVDFRYGMEINMYVANR